MPVLDILLPLTLRRTFPAVAVKYEPLHAAQSNALHREGAVIPTEANVTHNV